MGRAMGRFSMLRRGDKIAVAVSGGKDSLSLLHGLVAYRKRTPFPYDLVAVTLEQGKFKLPIRALEDKIRGLGVEWILREDTATLSLIAENVPHGCDVCSRHRRYNLYKIASELGCSVLALGIPPTIAPNRCSVTFSSMAGSRPFRLYRNRRRAACD